MSLLAATQIPKPADEQAFERASIVLWRGLLNDPNVQRNGRRGQRQNGVDLFGIRNGDPTHHVGIQCKLKSDGHVLSESEIRVEVNKALTFKPDLREYFIITTAPDDVDNQELARELTAQHNASGRRILIYVWGWNTLEEKITEDADSRKAFDPDYGPFSEKILIETREVLAGQEDIHSELSSGFSVVMQHLESINAKLAVSPGDGTLSIDALEAHLDAEIDGYRDIANGGKPRTALPLFEKLLLRVQASASGRILFRIKANIGICELALGDEPKAAKLLAEAYECAVTEPKAIANKGLSLLLQGQWQELVSFGVEQLKSDPTNEWLAGYLIQAISHSEPSVIDPLELVPTEVRASAPVAVAQVDFLRRHRPSHDWWAAARKAVVSHPDDPNARQFAAEAEIDEILSSQEFQTTRLLSLTSRKRIEQSVVILLEQWEKACSNEGNLRPEAAALCCNVIAALHALDDMPRATAVVRQGIEKAPEDFEITRRAALIAVDAPDDDLAQQTMLRLPPGPDLTMLAFRYHSSHGNWAEVAKLSETDDHDIPEVERLVVRTGVRLAALRIGNEADREAKIRAIGADVTGDARASIIVADFARMEGLGAVSEEAYTAAVNAIDGESHIAARLMVAFHASYRSDWRTTADLLDGYVVEDHDSNELRTLAQALVNDSPIRQRAIRFFERLPKSIREQPYYLHAEGLLHFNRGALKQAEVALRNALALEPRIDGYLSLFSTLRRLDRSHEIGPILDSLDLRIVIGNPGQKMYLAQELQKAGQAAQALHYAYGVLLSARNDPKAAIRYFGLLMCEPDETTIPPTPTVAIDTWVRLEDDHGKTFSFLIEEGEGRPAENVFGPTHPMAALALNHSVGETFVVKAKFGEDRTWRIAEIKHKYLHALHDIMGNFENQFPDSKGFYSVAVSDGDIQPVLDQIRNASEAHRQLADLYLLQHFPLNMVATRLGGHTIQFVEYVRGLEQNIETCMGNLPEREAALKVISHYQQAGAVLDTYTAWTVATMDAFDVITAVFGKLVVPQYVIDEIRSMRGEEETTGKKSMTIAYRDGQFIRQEHTAEDRDLRRRFIAEQLQKIEANCQVEPAAAPDTPSDLATILTDTFGVHVLDAANISANGYLLLSEDIYFRQVSEAAVSTKGAWLQVVFQYAHHQGKIDLARYAGLIIKLARRQHSHLSIDAAILGAALETDQQSDLPNFQALAAFIGTRNADILSHINVVSSFLSHLWQPPLSSIPVKSMQATGIMISQLVQYRQNDWALTIAVLRHFANIKLRRYIDGWMIGHFLPTTTLNRAEQEFSQLIARLKPQT